MSYSDTLVAGKIIDLRKSEFRPWHTSKEQALDMVATSFALDIWRTIEPTIQGKIDFTDLLKEQYPRTLGAAKALGIEKEFLTKLGMLASDAPRNVFMWDQW